MIPSTPSFLKRISVTYSWSDLILSLCLLLMKLKDKGITLETPGKLSAGVSKQGAAIRAHWAFLYNAQSFLSGGFSWILRVFSSWSSGNSAQLLISVILGNEVLGKNPIQQLPLLTSAPAGWLQERPVQSPRLGVSGKGGGGAVAWPGCYKSSEQAIVTVLELYFYFLNLFWRMLWVPKEPFYVIFFSFSLEVPLKPIREI